MIPPTTSPPARFALACLLASSLAPAACGSTPSPADAHDAAVEASTADRAAFDATAQDERAPDDAASDIAPREDVASDARGDGGGGDAGAPPREVVHTDLALDLTARTGRARITMGPSPRAGATLEAGGLTVRGVTDGAGAALPFRLESGALQVELPASASPSDVVVDYTFLRRTTFDGWTTQNSTFTWPYGCGNLFPCHSDPADGTTFALALTGVPDGGVAVFPPAIPAQAPAYQLAFVVGNYEAPLELGRTPAGTRLIMRNLPGDRALATQGGSELLAAFGWLETTLGPYTFGGECGTVEAPLPYNGGMEHHPYWFITRGSLGSREVNVHEAVHGWFGDGVRIACWEDFVLAEGTTTYVTARAIGATAGAAREAEVWATYETRLTAALRERRQVAWTADSCGAIDINDGYFTGVPYYKGAFFYRALAARVGVDALDRALGTFYRAHVGRAARMQDVLDAVRMVTGYDPTACATAWLRNPRAERGPATCP